MRMRSATKTNIYGAGFRRFILKNRSDTSGRGCFLRTYGKANICKPLDRVRFTLKILLNKMTSCQTLGNSQKIKFLFGFTKNRLKKNAPGKLK